MGLNWNFQKVGDSNQKTFCRREIIQSIKLFQNKFSIASFIASFTSDGQAELDSSEKIIKIKIKNRSYKLDRIGVRRISQSVSIFF